MRKFCYPHLTDRSCKTPIWRPIPGRGTVDLGCFRSLARFRHSCATLLLAQGVNPGVVMETLGHSQVSLTLNTYSHVVPALQKEAATKKNAALGGS